MIAFNPAADIIRFLGFAGSPGLAGSACCFFRAPILPLRGGDPDATRLAHRAALLRARMIH
ncbi:MAG: hypothetical protein ABSH24_30685 [Bryobacteraceae bacterium]